MTYRSIGSIFKEGNVILQVVESKDPSNCLGCWYNAHHKENGKFVSNYGFSCCCHGNVCTPFYRKDKKHVIFKKLCEISL